VFSDVHANRDALEAVLDVGQRACAGLVCLGDLTGYGPDTEECVRIIRGLSSTFDPCIILGGNHDAVLSGKIPLEWFNRSAQSSVRRTKKKLSNDSLNWISSLPDSLDLETVIPFSRAMISHGSPLEPLTGYLFGGDETDEALAWLGRKNIEVCFTGHTHQTAVFSTRSDLGILYPVPGTSISLEGSIPVIVNPGSTGFPRSFNGSHSAEVPGEGTSVSEASFPAYYAVWDTDSKTVNFCEARYDRRPMEKRLDSMF